MGCQNSKIIDETIVESSIVPVDNKIETVQIKTKFQVNIIRPNPMSEFDPKNLRIQIPKVKN
jgi:hypothetical protein